MKNNNDLINENILLKEKLDKEESKFNPYFYWRENFIDIERDMVLNKEFFKYLKEIDKLELEEFLFQSYAKPASNPKVFKLILEYHIENYDKLSESLIQRFLSSPMNYTHRNEFMPILKELDSTSFKEIFDKKIITKAKKLNAQDPTEDFFVIFSSVALTGFWSLALVIFQFVIFETVNPWSFISSLFFMTIFPKIFYKKVLLKSYMKSHIEEWKIKPQKLLLENLLNKS